MTDREAGARAGAEAMWQMISDLYPGFDRQVLDALTRAMQDKYGSPGRQFDLAVQAAMASLEEFNV